MTIQRYDYDIEPYDDGDLCKWEDVERYLAQKDMAYADATEELRTELAELRARLEVFTEGMPSSYHLDRLWNLAVLKDMEYSARWLSRIASANEVHNETP